MPDQTPNLGNLLNPQWESHLTDGLAGNGRVDDSLLETIIPGQLPTRRDAQIRELSVKLLPTANGLPPHADLQATVSEVAGLIIGKFYRDHSREKPRKDIYQRSINRVSEQATHLLQARDLQEELRSFLSRGLARSILLIMSARPDTLPEELATALWRKTEGSPGLTFELTAGFISGCALRLLSDLNIRRATIADLRRFLGFHKLPARRTTCPVPRDKYTMTLSSKLVQTVREVLATHACFSESAETIWPLASGRDWLIQAMPRALDGQHGVEPARKHELASQMWALIQGMSDLTNDVFDILTHAYLKKPLVPGDNPTIHVDEVLKLRGLKPKLGGGGRRGGYTREQRRDICNALDQIANLWLQPKSSRPERGARQGRLFELLRSGTNEPLATISEDLEAFSFRPGDALSDALLGPSRQIALLGTKALEYNPLTQVYEKRLIRYLSWIWRVRAANEAYCQPYRVSTVLDAINVVPSAADPGRTRTRFETALNRVQDDGLIGSWHYSKPLDRTKKKGWLPAWLQSTLVIDPPGEIRHHYRSLTDKPGRPA